MNEKTFILPASFAQQRLWFLEQLEPNNFAYNVPWMIQCDGILNVLALRQTLQTIVDRHESLRTTFSATDGTPVQVVAETHPLSIKTIDLTVHPPADRQAKAQQLTIEEARRPFQLTSGPLFRATLLRLGETSHVLLLTMHHIIFDGWSQGVFCHEIESLYTAFSTGQPSPLPEMSIQYADYAHWQRQWMQGAVLEQQLAYWKKQLAGAQMVPCLPTARPRPLVQTIRGDREVVAIPKHLSDALQALSRREGATLFMTLLAAFKTLLYRYTGQADVLVGAAVANRNRSETKGLIGFFTNMLVMRTDLAGNPTFRDVLHQVRGVALEAYDNQDIPLEKLVEELEPERDTSYSPLFQVTFSLQSASTSTIELPDLCLTSMEIDNKTSKFDLTLSMEETSEGLRGCIKYNADLFEATTIARMAKHLPILLKGIVTDPDRRLADLPILTEAERHRLLIEWNDTQAEYPLDKCIHELFEEQVEKNPSTVAVIYENESYTYRELNHRANQLAHYLRRMGVGPEVLVGVCAERSLEMIVGFLGILKAGGAYLPLDPAYPPERKAFVLQDAQISVLLTQEKLEQTLDLSPDGVRVIRLDADWESIARENDGAAPPTSGVQADNLAYVIYTSGSTGRPKGVLVPHAGLPNVTEAQKRNFGIEPGDRVLQFASPSFDASIFEIAMALAAGATLCPGSTKMLPDTQMLRWLKDMGITIILLTPSTLAVLPLEELESLHTITVGGETCPQDLVARWSPGRRFFNLYGPTEATIWTMVAQCTDDDQAPPIGRPIANTRVYLLDAHLQPLPVGVPGELCIGGLGLARGYMNRPGLTAERFIPDPFSDVPSARMYRTGDLAQYLPDGNVEFLGRIDHQVKIRGFRIEIGEIEAVLAQHPAVEMAAVAALDGTQLVAYVVLHPGQTPDTGELRRFLKTKLPDYMLPSVFMILDSLPLMYNGKIDRRALPAPDGARPELEDSFVAPQTSIEKAVVEIWSDILGVERIGIHDNFFELGGHSLFATQLLSRLQASFQVEIPLLYFFDTPTVAGLVENIETIRWAAQERQPLSAFAESGREKGKL